VGLLARLEARGAEAKMTTSHELWKEIYGGYESATGKSVNWKTALQVSTVLACARRIAEGIALPPFKLLRESADGRTKLPAKDLRLYSVLTRRANLYQTAFNYFETLGLHLALYGQHFSFINQVRGEIVELLPFEPQHVEVKRATDGTLTYRVTTEDGAPMEFTAESIWHVKGPSWNSYLGLEVVKLARDAIGLAMATEESHAKMHKHGARVGGLISIDGTLGSEQQERLHKYVEQNFGGSANAHRTMILDRAAKFTAASQTGVDSQHLETRRYQVEEVSRAMGVIPIVVGYSDKAATYASAGEMFRAHERLTLAPLWKKIEQDIDAYLLSQKERDSGVFAAFADEGMKRGSPIEKKDLIIAYVNGGVMTPNEGRALLDLNPDGDPASDKLRIPANITGSVPDADPARPQKE